MTHANGPYNAFVKTFFHESGSPIDLRETLRGLQTLLAVASTGSFVAAAARLSLTPSAVSKIVTRAEERLGVRLVSRTTRRLSLTTLGEAYVTRGRSVVSDLEALDREMAARDVAIEGTLRVSAPATYGSLRIAPHLARFQAAHPAVRFELSCDDRMVDLVAERIDVAVRIVIEPPQDVVARCIEDDRRGLYASPAYLRRARKPRTIEDLAKHPALFYIYGRSLSARTVDLGLVSPDGVPQPVRMSVAFASDSVLAVLRAAQAGLGIAELPSYLVARELQEGTLVEVMAGALPVSRRAYAMYHPSRYLPARVRALVKHLVKLR